MKEVFGDVVLLEGHSLEARIISHFTEQPIHVALRTEPSKAVSIELVKGVVRYDLRNPAPEYSRLMILGHKYITPTDRDKLWRLNLELSTDYDLLLLINLGIKKLFKKEPDSKDMSHESKYLCTSRIAKMYDIIGFPINYRIHPSQIESKHFLENPDFFVKYEWVRTSA